MSTAHRDAAPERRYLPLLGAFAFLVGLLTHGAARHRRAAEPGGALELTEQALATFFLTRMLAREKVGSPVRAPFVEPAPGADPDDPRGASKQPTGHGLHLAIGELLTCTRCLGPWAASALTFGAAFAPRHTMIATRIAALGGANILAHGWFAAVCKRAEG